jgi:hypothetical protein
MGPSALLIIVIVRFVHLVLITRYPAVANVRVSASNYTGRQPPRFDAKGYLLQACLLLGKFHASCGIYSKLLVSNGTDVRPGSVNGTIATTDGINPANRRVS